MCFPSFPILSGHIAVQQPPLPLLLLFLRILLFSVYNNSRTFKKRRAMSGYNLHQMRELESYGQHLFCLDQKYLSFSTEEPQEGNGALLTKISNDAGEGCSGAVKREVPWIDEHFEMNFMREHEFITIKYIRNYMELFQGEQEEQQEGEKNREGQREESASGCAGQNGQEKQAREVKAHKCSTVDKLLNTPKIADYCSFVQREFEPCVWQSLLPMMEILWGEYMKSEDKKMGEREIIEFTNRLLSASFVRKMGEMLPNKGKGVSLATIKTLVNVIANTLFFIGGEYFLNPYFQLEVELTVREFQNYELFLYDSCVYDDEGEVEEVEEVKGRKMVKRDSFQGE